ncbi:SDR family NAD(P)-dependent oxidoreductase [Halalkalicoccus jeotgali]|uniref:Short-chain dehydrogenase/reductase SDR n=1 Tax=Halalkalicoccus jeotgali (strain DSM 18796 / CECT 7217 / JCM 14584 / KCTC 4019 / B3) TaxID=795797 RepID=D8J9R0_HALJB|nr:SDR family NAD(P)-dependent oxidoreductase [Halalkalicoccus jeotgali]ADJ16399.1 short-chain dehydrogenase/reductase SDR [Halalkalicoccus jeotgali B3]ELY37133.1 short-chain dehydrogenase/reductase SDR [Halalkalicoccus jeotgali B3]
MIEPDLDGHTVLVTGSATGLGRSLALACAKRGADVAVHYRTSGDDAREVAQRARETGVEATSVRGDVTDPGAVDELFDGVEAALGTVDVLVNNVGAFAPIHWEEMAFETWQTVMETNVTGTYLCSKRALPAMREAGWGRIVNVGYASSERGLINPKNAPYFMAKSGVLMFTRMLAADTSEEGITVNAVSPYVIENSDEFPADLPRDRPASFEDVIQAVFTFLEADSDYISGANVEVSGGWLPEDV